MSHPDHRLNYIAHTFCQLTSTAHVRLPLLTLCTFKAHTALQLSGTMRTIAELVLEVQTMSRGDIWQFVFATASSAWILLNFISRYLQLSYL